MSNKLVRELQRRMEALNLDPTTTAKKAGLSESFVRDIIRGKSKEPKRSGLTKVAKVLGCTVSDLTGEAAPRRSSGVVEIAELDIRAPSGAGGSPGGESEYTDAVLANEEAGLVVGVHAMPEASFREAYGISPRRVRIIAVKGNSMVPDLWPGQRVMVDVEDRWPSPGGIFIVWDGAALVLKYVEVIANSDPLRVRISSKNPAFLPYERTVDEAYINGRVVGVWARV